MAGQHRRLRIAGQQQVEAIHFIEGHRLAHQSAQLIRQAGIIRRRGRAARQPQLPAGQIDDDPRAGGQHQPPPQAWIEQQIPALLTALPEIGSTAQQQQPGTEGPGIGQGVGTSGCEQTTGRLGAGIQLGQQSRGSEGLQLAAFEPLGPAVAEGQQLSRSLMGPDRGRQHGLGGGHGVRTPVARQLLQPGGWQHTTYADQPPSRLLAAAPPEAAPGNRRPRQGGQLQSTTAANARVEAHVEAGVGAMGGRHGRDPRPALRGQSPPGAARHRPDHRLRPGPTASGH